MNDTEFSSIIEFDEDLANVEAPKPLPAGVYDGVIQTAEIVKSKDGEKDMLKLGINISADQYPADYTDGNPNGTTLYYNMFIDNSPRNKFLMKQFILAIGAPLSNRIDTTTLIGLPGRFEVTNSNYQGMDMANIRRAVA